MPLLRVAIATVVLSLDACAAPVTDEVELGQTSAPAPSHDISGEITGDLGVVRAWGFEAASADCNGWSASGGSSIRSVPSHSGAYACKLCPDGTSPEMALSRRVAGLPPGRYVVSAWLRRHGDPDVAPMRARIVLGGSVSTAALDDRWQAVGEGFDVDTEIASAHVRIVADVSEGEDCLLVDDVVVGRR